MAINAKPDLGGKLDIEGISSSLFKPMNYRALCFVDMPFGQKPDLKSGVIVDFDQIYNEAIKPAIEECGLEAFVGTKSARAGYS